MMKLRYLLFAVVGAEVPLELELVLRDGVDALLDGVRAQEPDHSDRPKKVFYMS